jgi:hypothetical protein
VNDISLIYYWEGSMAQQIHSLFMLLSRELCVHVLPNQFGKIVFYFVLFMG